MMLALRFLMFSFIYIGGEKVYDVTSYLNDHPGGSEVILDIAGATFIV